MKRQERVKKMGESKRFRKKGTVQEVDSYTAVKGQEQNELFYQMASIYKEVSQGDGQLVHRIFSQHQADYPQDNFMEEIF